MSDELGAVVVLTLKSNNLPDTVEGGQHITLLYFGDQPLGDSQHSQLLDATSSVAQLYSGDGIVKTNKVEYFGEDGDAVVVTLDKSTKSAAVQFHHMLIKQLNPELYSIFRDAETYPDYKPHVTLGYISEGYTHDGELEIPEELEIDGIAVWNGTNRTEFAFNKDLEHYGILRKSGRYPWGSGENPYQRSRSFMGLYSELQDEGFTEKEIAQALKLNTRELRQHKAMAKAQIKKDQIATARKLKDKGWKNVAIGNYMGINESSVRDLLNPVNQERQSRVENTAQKLKDEMADGSYIDIGRGSELHMDGVTRHTLQNAVTWLEDEGYKKHHVDVRQLGTGKDTTMIVLAPEGVEWREVAGNQQKIKVIGASTPDGGKSWNEPRAPQNVPSDRIDVRYGPEGGADKDGIIEIRPGTSDLDLGQSRYAQVRIAVDGTHYLKGVAVYADNLPEGVDIRFNTNKQRSENKLEAMKPMGDDPMNPWGAVIKADGQRGALNIVNEEGDWYDWSRNLSSQMLSKQKPELAKKQLDLTYNIKKAEFDEINSLTNPTVKRHLLEKFADGADSSAVYLKAKGLPRTQNHVILPFPDMQENEIYAPQYNDGETVVLIRHPHGGIFEIPELKVNNRRNKNAQKIIGQAVDAVGIHPNVAAQLSGADFDGDTVLVIPNNNQSVKTSRPLRELEGFDPQVMYKGGPDTKLMTNTQTEMGLISNLITDMSVQDASPSEIARAVKHSMVVIDAEKHGLDYKQSYEDNGIRQLKKRYQFNPETGRSGGASTLISRAKSRETVPERRLARVNEGGPIDSETGRVNYTPTGRTRVKRTKNKATGEWETILDSNGQPVVETVMQRSTKMAETDDAYTLSSGTFIESIYADHANKLKSLGNEARKEMLATPPLEYSPSAFKTYSPQVQSLNAKLNRAKSNAPLERKAQVLANQAMKQKRQAHPEMDKDEISKEETKALALYRARTGAGKQRINIEPDEWEAIQAGAISNNKLKEILANTDLDKVKELATPRTSVGMSTAMEARARAMYNSGYTQAEIADALGVSTSTINNAVNS